jgi:hypothetical protein
LQFLVDEQGRSVTIWQSLNREPSRWEQQAGRPLSGIRWKRKQHRISKWRAESSFQMAQKLGREQSRFCK